MIRYRYSHRITLTIRFGNWKRFEKIAQSEKNPGIPSLVSEEILRFRGRRDFPKNLTLSEKDFW